ncbi:MAG: M6 family metalloprotease domain-containing protein [Desulfuromonadales bacterium]|nr:M6 family metalloprotease domain-containing protein [Desulfuromonadales bacterium]
MGRNWLRTVFASVAVMVLLMLSPHASLAAPASGRIETLLQPTGQKLSAALKGDERFNWRTAGTGEIILQDSNGFWQYATLGKKGVALSGARYGLDPKPGTALSEDQLVSWRAAQLATSSATLIATPPLTAAAPTTAPTQTHPTLLLLVDFLDIEIRTTETSWAQLLAGSTGSTLDRYFSEVSAGQLAPVPAEEMQGIGNDGVVRVRLNYAHPNTGGQILRDNQLIARNALIAADPFINFAPFDRDGNGYLSGEELNIVVIVAGYEASYGIGSPSVWAHWWTLDSALILDGKGLATPGFGGYVQAGELHGDHQATIGVIAHELGHNLGLPDMYDYDGSSFGVGVHSLMASGCWGYTSGNWLGSSPTHLDPWSKVRKGFVTPITAATAGDYLLDSIATGSYDVLKVPTPDPSQYFLFENRQLAGFDQALATWGVNGGVAIWHIDETVILQRANTGINNDERHKGVDLEEANESVLGYSQLDSRVSGNYNHYYYFGGAWRFAADTVPDSDLYDGALSGIGVEVPVASSSTMQTRILLGAGDSSPPVVSSTVPAAGGNNVAFDQTIFVNFNEEVKTGPFFSSISVVSGGTVPTATSIAGRTLAIDPQVLLNKATTYTVTVPAGAVTDLAGNALASSFSFTFTTVRRK